MNRSRDVAGKVLGIAVLLLSAVATGSPAVAEDQQKPVKIGVLAKRGVPNCLEKWNPTAEYLTRVIPGHSFTIVPLGYDEIDSTVEHGEVDFVLANPGFYVSLERSYRASRLATLKNRPLRKACTVYGGVIFRRADRDDIERQADLKGKTFMAVHERSFGGWQVAWRELKEHGIDPRRDFTELSFGGTHDAVVYAVRDGKVDAGTVRTDTLERMAAEGKIRLEEFHALEHDHIGEDVCEFPSLHSTDMYPEWPLAELAHASDELAEKAGVALIGMPAECPAATAARCAGWTVPLNYQPVHECLKELRIGPYKDFGKITLGDVLKRYWPWIVASGAFLAMAIITTLYVVRLNRKLSRVSLDLSHELSERKRAEETLRKSEEQSRSLVETTSDWVWEVDRNGFYTYASPRVKDLVGYEPEEVIGKTPFDFMPADEAERVARFFKDRAESREPFAGLENTNLHRDGRHVVLETNGVPILDAGGNLLGYRGIDRDITERKRAEEALRESEERYRSLADDVLDTSAVGIFILDSDFRVVWVNQALECYFGLRRDDVTGKDKRQLIRERISSIFEDSETFVERVFATYDNNTYTENFECHVLRDGEREERWLEHWSQPIRSGLYAGGRIEHYYDITERKHAEEELTAAKDRAERARAEFEQIASQLLQSDKMASIGQLAAGVAHEINNPIGFISSNLNSLGEYAEDLKRVLAAQDELLQECLDGSPASKARAEEVKRVRDESDVEFIVSDLGNLITESVDGAKRVRDIVADLRDFSHVDSPDVTEADINELLDKTINVAWNELKYKTEVVREYGQIPAISCYGGKLGQVFLNLLVNAAQAIEVRGTITIRTGQSGANIWIEVEDTGCGIPPENVERVFDPFFTTKKVGRGTGMGLHLARNIIEAHDGYIDCKSTVGEGTTFRIVLAVEGPSQPQENQSESIA